MNIFSIAKKFHDKRLSMKEFYNSYNKNKKA